MGLFAWTDDLKVGHRGIDDDHQKLVAMVNELHDAMQAGRGNDVVGKVLDKLVAYTGEHFAREETEMQRIKYPRYLAHKQEHDKLLAEVGALQKSFASGQSMLTLKVSKFLKDWLLTHIKQTDLLLAKALQ